MDKYLKAKCKDISFDKNKQRILVGNKNELKGNYKTWLKSPKPNKMRNGQVSEGYNRRRKKKCKKRKNL